MRSIRDALSLNTGMGQNCVIWQILLVFQYTISLVNTTGAEVVLRNDGIFYIRDEPSPDHFVITAPSITVRGKSMSLLKAVFIDSCAGEGINATVDGSGTYRGFNFASCGTLRDLTVQNCMALRGGAVRIDYLELQRRCFQIYNSTCLISVTCS